MLASTPVPNRLRRLWLSGLVLVVLPTWAQERVPAPGAAQVLEIGVLPYVGLSELIRAYGPLARHLEAELGRPVRIVTAQDYASFLAHTLRRDYPLVVTASHFARLAELDAGYRPVLRPLTSYRILVLVAKDASFRQPGDLRGARIAVPGRLAQTTLMGRAWLAAHGVPPDEVRLFDTNHHKNALLALLHGDVEACIVSEGAFRHMKEEDRAGLRELPPRHPPREAIPVIFAVSPTLPRSEQDRLTRAILRYANEHPEGRAWIHSLKYEGLRAPTADELRALDADVAELRRALQALTAAHPPRQP